MKRFILLLALLALLVPTVALAYPSRPFECIAPSGAGGGWDTTMRMLTRVLTEKEYVNQPMPVVNKIGGGGGVALAYMQSRKGDDHTLIVYSPPLLYINLTGQTELGYQNLTPLAMMITDFQAVAVRADSPYQTINEVMDALKADPTSIITAGASSPGSMDHVSFLQIAHAAGVENIKEIPYIAFQGGEAMANLMGGHVDLLCRGLTDVAGPLESGDLRVLAVTTPERLGGVFADVPTLKEMGIDTVYANWRGIFGPPEMPAAAVEFMVDALEKVSNDPMWEEICKNNSWVNSFRGPEEFKAFLDQVNEEAKVILGAIGMLKQ